MTFALVTAVLIGGLMLALVLPALRVHPSAITLAKGYFEGLHADPAPACGQIHALSRKPTGMRGRVLDKHGTTA